MWSAGAPRELVTPRWRVRLSYFPALAPLCDFLPSAASKKTNFNTAKMNFKASASSRLRPPQLLSSSALIPLVVIVNAENTITNKTNNTNASNKDTAIYVVHPNVGLRPPSIGIGHLIIQPMEITDGSQSSHFSVTLWASTGIQLYRKIHILI